MAYKYLLVHLLLLGYVYLARGQEQTVVVQEVADQMGHASNQSSQESQEEEEDDDSAMTRMQNVTSLEEFISLLKRNGNRVNTGDIVSSYSDNSGAIYISTGGRMAQPDDCSPRDTTVRLTFDNTSPNVVFFPRCTKIERCGGCCASPHLECVPSYTERVSYKVIKAEQPYPGSSHLEWKGEYSTVILDRHVNCRVQCSLTPDKCGPKKEFQERQCDCRCRVYERCQPPRVWDPEECECKCAEVLTCCTIGESCGSIFLKDTCECGVPDNHIQLISNIGNLTQQRLDEYFALLNSTSLASSTTLSSTSTTTIPTTTPAATTTPTTTTTTVTTGSMSTATTTSATAGVQATDPCQSHPCPGNFSPHTGADGLCACRRITGGGRRRPRNSVQP